MKGTPRRETVLRSLSVAVIIAILLTTVGAFGTSNFPLWRRLLYWLLLMPGGGFAVSFVQLLLTAKLKLNRASLWQALLLWTAVSPVYAAVVWSSTALIFSFPLKAALLPYYIGPVWVIGLAMTALNFIVIRPEPVASAVQIEAAPPAPFGEKLSYRLRGAEVLAVEAEDHYCRIHTDRGAELINMRFTDALNEVAALDGARVHRSWWVARRAILDVRKNDGRAELSLSCGACAPVSRTYARELRSIGWW